MDNNENSVFLKSIERFRKPTMPPDVLANALSNRAGSRPDPVGTAPSGERTGMGSNLSSPAAIAGSQDHVLNISERGFRGCAMGAAPTWRQHRKEAAARSISDATNAQT